MQSADLNKQRVHLCCSNSAQACAARRGLCATHMQRPTCRCQQVLRRTQESTRLDDLLQLQLCGASIHPSFRLDVPAAKQGLS